MDAFGKDDVKALLDHGTGWCVSLYLPTERAGHETEQNPIRLKNLLQQAEELLTAEGVRRPEAGALLAGATALLHDPLFWRRQSDGLAVFVSGSATNVYRVPLRFQQMAVVGHSFHLKPLLPFLAGDGRYYLLALSQNSVRLMEGTREALEEVDVGSLPVGLEEALQIDATDRGLQWHSPASRSPGGGRSPVYHGASSPEVEAKSRIRRYFHLLDEGLREALAGQSAPLVLAGVEYLFPIYREANTYPYLMEQGVPGNPEELSPRDLHQRAWDIVAPFYNQAREKAWAKYQSLAGTGLASADPREVVSRAYFGRVESLFFSPGCQVWGTIDPETGAVALADTPDEPGAQDLSDLATVYTILKQGQAYPALEEARTEACLLAAVFRY